MISPDRASVEAWLFGFIGPDASRGREAWIAAGEFLAALGDPQDRVRAVHIVGTAGKGTVARLVADELRRRGETVGLHLSPHVHDVRERFTVADELPSWADVAAAADEIQAVVDRGHRPTFFAVTTAVALVLARRAETDHLVIEAGIGGRHDATNHFHRADTVTAITAIGLDHQDVLGETVEQITHEKVAVTQGRESVVVGPQPSPEAMDVIRRFTRLHRVDRRDVAGFEPASGTINGSSGDWRSDAVATARSVLSFFVPDIPEPTFTALPGRYEVHEVDGLRWIFDGAHNPMKLTAVAGTVADESGPRVGIVSVGAGKELDESAAAIAPVLDRAVVVAFGPPPGAFGPESHPVDEIADALRAAGVAEVEIAIDASAAVIAAKRNEPATVVVTGSFLHLTAVRQVLLRN